MFTEKTKPLQGLIHELFAPELRVAETYDSSAGDIEAMTIVGMRTGGAVTAVKTDTIGANKGAITLGAPAFDPGAPVGVYSLVCIEPYNSVGPVPAVFELSGPDGFSDVVVAGTPYNGPVNFTKGIGTADAAGDKSSIAVTQVSGSGVCVPLALPGTVADGSDVPHGIVLYPVPKSATPTRKTTLVDCSVVQDGNLTYPPTATTNQKAAINAALFETRRIKIKPGTQMVAG
jgi:hypothetical protein